MANVLSQAMQTMARCLAISVSALVKVVCIGIAVLRGLVRQKPEDHRMLLHVYFCVVLLLFSVLVWLAICCMRCIRQRRYRFSRFGRCTKSANGWALFKRKPLWVIDEVIRLKALLPDAGVRTIAMTFNRLHRSRDHVSKSFVAGVIRKHRYAIDVLRRDIRNRVPRALAINAVWGFDLTGKQDAHGERHAILGIVDHGSRFAVMLAVVRNQNFYTLAGHLLIAIGQFGIPKAIRTDNGSTLISWRFRRFLSILGIRHQRTAVGCPWQNGRIERLFGTLKQKLDQVVVRDRRQLSFALSTFRHWYNEIRPHQNLAERTPTEAWNCVDVYCGPPQSGRWFTAWGGLLRGYRLRW
jgi:putative transposase